MKKTVLILGVIALFSCAKEEISTEVIENSDNGNTFKYLGADKYMDTDNQTQPCQPGTGYCSYYCCVTPSVVEDFMAAIDTDNLNNFLTTEKINALSNEDDFIKGLLEDAKVGEVNVAYVTFGNKVGFMFGEGDVSSSSHDAALVLDL